MKKVVMVSFLMVLGATLSTLPLVSAAAATVTSFAFNLIGPQTTKADSSSPFAGDTLQTTGSGSFDTSTGSIVASGSFTHFKASGAVNAKGTWKATSFGSFTSFGGPNAGLQGGELNFTATFFPNGEAPVEGLSVKVVCRINAPSGFTTHEGVMVEGLFTDVTRGATLFHVNE